jgi:DNA repair protein RadC
MSKRKSAQGQGGDELPFPARRDREPKVKIRTPKDIVPLCGLITHAEQEVVMVFTLDGNNQVSTSHMVTVGLVNQSQIHPREVFKHAIRHNAVSIIVVHNHPSGNLEPSESDLIATRRLVEVAKTIGIPLLDHVIVSPEGHASIRDRFPAYFG